MALKLYNTLTRKKKGGYPSKEEAPWGGDNPADELVYLVKNRLIQPCRVLDIGCGYGRNSNWLAEKGFNVSAIDIQSKAIEEAKKTAREKGLGCVDYNVANALDLPYKDQEMEFVIDYGTSHYYSKKEKQQKFEKETARVLKSGGLLLYQGFSEKHPKAKINKKLAFRSIKDIKQLYGDDFEILKTKEISWRPREKTDFKKHRAIVVLMKKK